MKNLQKRSRKLSCSGGFTLVELIVVIVIIGILAAVLVPRLGGFTDKAKGTEALVAAKQVATAYDAYVAEKTTTGKFSITAVDDAVNEYVAKLSGVPESQFKLETNGGFTVTIGGNSAGRTSGLDKASDADRKVEMKQATVTPPGDDD